MIILNTDVCELQINKIDVLIKIWKWFLGCQHWEQSSARRLGRKQDSAHNAGVPGWDAAQAWAAHGWGARDRWGGQVPFCPGSHPALGDCSAGPWLCWRLGAQQEEKTRGEHWGQSLEYSRVLRTAVSGANAHHTRTHADTHTNTQAHNMGSSLSLGSRSCKKLETKPKGGRFHPENPYSRAYTHMSCSLPSKNKTKIQREVSWRDDGP